jgi:hypothetical protein
MLSNIQETIERSIYERIRLVLVEEGYLPDILDFLPETPANYKLFQEAITTITNTKGFAIELYNHQDNLNLGALKVPRIVINPQPFLEGSLGGDGLRRYIREGLVYKSVAMPAQTSDFNCHIHLVSSTAQQTRILNALLAKAIPRRAYIPFVQELEGNFFIEQQSSFLSPDAMKGMKETIFRFSVPDLFEIDDITIQENIKPLTRIDLQVDVKNSQGKVVNSSNTQIP